MLLSVQFHERHSNLLILAAIAGAYFPGMRLKFQSRIVRGILIFYTGISLLMQIATFASPFLNLFLISDEIFPAMSASSSNFLSMSKLIYFVWKGPQFYALCEYWDNVFMSDSYTKARQELISIELKNQRKFIVGSGTTICTGLFLFSLSQFTHPDKFSVPNAIPFRNGTWDFFIVASFYLIAYTIIGFVVTSVDTFFLLPCIWVKAELKRLQKSMSDMILEIEEKEDKFDRKSLEAMFDRKLRLWVEQHQKLLRFYKEFSKLYARLLEVQVSCMILAACLFTFSIVKGELKPFDALSAVIFFIPNYTMFFITCQYSDEIHEMSSQIFLQAFSKEWHRLSKNHKAVLNLIILRGKKYLEVRAYKLYPCSVSTFFQIFTTAYTLYSFLGSV